MPLQTADDVANAMLDAIETTIGTSPILRIFDGTLPANCAAADNGTILAEITCPSDWAAAAASRAKAKSGTWQDASANATGTADYFRFYTSGAVCKMQGSVTAGGGGGVMTVDNINFAAGQPFTITSFTINDNNA